MRGNRRKANARMRTLNGCLATGVALHDMNCGLKAYRAEVFENVRLYGERHRFVPVLAHHLGFSVTELVVVIAVICLIYG